MNEKESWEQQQDLGTKERPTVELAEGAERRHGRLNPARNLGLGRRSGQPGVSFVWRSRGRSGRYALPGGSANALPRLRPGNFFRG